MRAPARADKTPLKRRPFVNRSSQHYPRLRGGGDWRNRADASRHTQVPLLETEQEPMAVLDATASGVYVRSAMMRGYRLSQRLAKPSRPWGMKITIKMNTRPSGMR